MEYILPSGAKLIVTPSGFQQAMALQKALLKSVKGLPLNKEILEKDVTDVTALKDAVVNAATSDEVEQALFACFQRATYQGVLFVDTLDDPKMGEQARGDYYDVCWRTVEVNCGPFFKQTFSRLKDITQKHIATQGQ